MTQSIQERVQAGAAWLDENEPGWEEKVDLDSFDMANYNKHILVQLYGSLSASPFYAGYSQLNHGIQSGFEAPANTHEAWQPLTTAWKELISKRKEEQTSPQRELLAARRIRDLFEKNNFDLTLISPGEVVDAVLGPKEAE